METDPEPWTDGDALALKRARQAFRHRWMDCVQALVNLGGVEVTQSTLSKWENGKAAPKLPECIAAVREYYSSMDGQSHDLVDPAEVDDEFTSAIGSMLGDRPYSPRQHDLFVAVVERIRTGPPLSDADSSVIAMILHPPEIT